MIFDTVNQFVVLAACLIAGWFFGLASAPGSRKWKDRLRDSEVEHARHTDQSISDLKDRDARIAELEKENARLEKERDAALKKAEKHGSVATTAGAAVAGAAAGAALAKEDDKEPAKGDGWRGWFGWGRDNLARIKGIDEAREKRLNEMGYKTYREIEAMTAEDEAKLEERLELEKGTIAKENWRDQAKLLREGNEAEHEKQYA